MAVRFDIDSDSRFEESLDALARPRARAVVHTLGAMQGLLQWDVFKPTFNWQELPIPPIDSFPGSPPLYWFELPIGQPPPMQIVALLQDDLVICTCAREFPRQ